MHANYRFTDEKTKSGPAKQAGPYLEFKPNSDFKASRLFTTHSIHSVPNPHHYLSLKLKS